MSDVNPLDVAAIRARQRAIIWDTEVAKADIRALCDEVEKLRGLTQRENSIIAGSMHLQAENERLQRLVNGWKQARVRDTVQGELAIMTVTSENVRLRGVIAEVEKVVESPYWGTYWGTVFVPQPELRRALGKES